MKKIVLVILLIVGVSVESAFAQSNKRRVEQQQTQRSNADNLTTRAQISFPTEAKMPEDVVWRRDIYRELDLNNDANAGLYYPVEPVGSQMNLFTYIFKLFMLGQINVYEYRLDGNESFADDARMRPKTFLDNYHIFYEQTDQGTHIDNSDIPSREVTAYYIKESAYYDQASSTFHTKVLALCPIMKRQDDFSTGATSYPLFWVRYDDLAPFLAKQTLMTSNLNNAAVMSVDDYFTLNMYKGKIYKTNNMLGKTLAQYCTNDSAMSREQKRIETELTAFENKMWGDASKRDSLDSIGKLKPTLQKAIKKRNRRTDNSKVVAKTPRQSKTSSSSSARVTVRRERH